VGKYAPYVKGMRLGRLQSNKLGDRGYEEHYRGISRAMIVKAQWVVAQFA